MGGLISHREHERRTIPSGNKLNIDDFINFEEVDFSRTSGFEELGKLNLCKRLVWRDAFLYSFPIAICDMKNLESLDLSKNFIKQFPPEILNLENLTELILISSRLAELPEMIGNMTTIKKLILSDNGKLLYPFKIISNLHNLEYLNISGCNITDNMMIDLHLLSNLKYLDISSNTIEEFSSLEKLVNLEELDISSNYIFSLTGISNLKKLKTLTAKSCWNICELPSDISDCENLQVLNIIQSPIFELKYALPQSLREIYFSKDDIYFLEPQFMSLLHFTPGHFDIFDYFPSLSDECRNRVLCNQLIFPSFNLSGYENLKKVQLIIENSQKITFEKDEDGQFNVDKSNWSFYRADYVYDSNCFILINQILKHLHSSDKWRKELVDFQPFSGRKYSYLLDTKNNLHLCYIDNDNELPKIIKLDIPPIKQFSRSQATINMLDINGDIWRNDNEDIPTKKTNNLKIKTISSANVTSEIICVSEENTILRLRCNWQNIFNENAEVICKVESVQIAKLFYNGSNMFIIDEIGDVWCKGSNYYGSLGLGHADVVDTFTKISTLENVIDIKSISSTTIFQCDNSDIFICGNSSKVLRLYEVTHSPIYYSMSIRNKFKSARK